MLKLLSASMLSLSLLGCASSPPAEPPPNPMPTMYGTKWVPEAGAYIDYVTNDFYSWHYMGRERAPTPEEIAIWELNVAYVEARNSGNAQTAEDILAARDVMREHFKTKLSALAELDKVRMNARIAELAATAKAMPPQADPNAGVAGRPK